MLIRGDARQIPLRDNCVDVIVTSPPYFGLRRYEGGQWVGGRLKDCDHASAKIKTRFDYQFTSFQPQNKGSDVPQYRGRCPTCDAQWVDRQIGLEETPIAYVETLVRVFREIRRVMKPHATAWLNIGDSYVANHGTQTNPHGFKRRNGISDGSDALPYAPNAIGSRAIGLKGKDMVGIPWRVAFALQDDGWWLRSAIIWVKNSMPESVVDRPTTTYEHVFLLAKNHSYYYDAEAIKEPAVSVNGKTTTGALWGDDGNHHAVTWRNKRNVWEITTESYDGSHFATYPQALVTPCILAGTSQHGNCAKCGAPWARVTERKSRVGAKRGTQPSQFRANLQGPQQSSVGVDVTTVGWQPSCRCGTTKVLPPLVLDPFLGSGTTGVVAERLGRRWVGLDLAYQDLAAERTAQRGLKFVGDDDATDDESAATVAAV